MKKLLILQNRTPDEALKFFNDTVDMFGHIISEEMSELYREAIAWKQQIFKTFPSKKQQQEKWEQYPINDICRALIEGNGKMFKLNKK
jgi:hypothetical protein